MPSEAPSRARRALVTGATGFVGSHLVRTMVREGWGVHIVVRPTSDVSALGPERAGVKVHRHDGSRQVLTTALSEAAPDVVFHLASLFISEHKPDDVEPLISANILFPTLLLEAMAMTQVRCLVNTGTAWQHYRDAPYSPVCLYAATKQAFEAVLQYYVETHKFRAITLKLFDTYGPEDRRPKLFSLLAKAAGATEPLAMSAGDQQLDLVYIDDVVAALIAAGTASGVDRQTVNVGSGVETSINDLIATISAITGLRTDVLHNRDANGGLARLVADLGKAKQLLGYAPRTELATGLRKLLEADVAAGRIKRRWRLPSLGHNPG